jgi:hypothetical protein
MNHYYQNIHGWFDYEEVFKLAIDKAENGAKFVEIGAWKGKSTAFAGVEIINSGKDITFYAVDHFLGSEEHRNPVSDFYDFKCKSGELRTEYHANIEPVKSVVKTYDMTSAQASKMFKKASVDFIFLDGSHDFDSVCNDIEIWLPKLKPGGMIGGHDYTTHPTVKQAVDSYFSDYQLQIIGKSWLYTSRSAENGKD